MTNEEKILEILTGMQADIKTLNTRMDSLESKVDSLAESQAALAESHEEVRTSVNAILDWTDTVSAVVPIVPKIS